MRRWTRSTPATSRTGWPAPRSTTSPDLAGSDLRAPSGAVDEAGRRRWKQLVVRVVSDRPPVRLADLARLVTDGAAAGDPVALDLVDRAGEALVRPLLPLLARRRARWCWPVASSGRTRCSPPPSGARCTPRGAAPRLLPAGPGEAGAVWCALGLAGSPDEVARPVRDRLGLPT